jgi:nucleoid-associated protein YgaU
MGFMDKFSKMIGGNKPSKIETVKGPSLTLKENGIDPAGLKFSFHKDGSIEVAGSADSQFDCDRICKVLGEMPNISSVKNSLTVGAPEPEAQPEAAAEETVAAETEPKGRTYTVQSGDTLWEISNKMYGNGGKYMKIFDANTSLLESPDKIHPGQELVIPDLG